MDILLKERMVLYGPHRSDTVYVRGIHKSTTADEVVRLVSLVAEPLEVDLSQRSASGEIWVKYKNLADTQQAILVLHQRIEKGVYISARYELGKTADGKHVSDPSTHNTRVRNVSTSDTRSALTSKRDTYNYSSDSLLVNRVEYPFPSGLYLSKTIYLTRRFPSNDPLLALITDPSLGNKFAKEISEAMAMCDAVDRACKLICGRAASLIPNISVFVLGDGKRPLCAACLCLQFPNTWKFFSIDPILCPVEVGPYRERFFQHNCLSQNFEIPNKSTSFAVQSSKDTEAIPEIPPVNIVIACHSHAPLQEFVSRLPTPAIVISMPCCANYSHLDLEPILSFDDFEVYSPKRKVHIYSIIS